MKLQKECKSRPNLAAEWELGSEYEFAYCSRCGHMEHAGWDTRSEAVEQIGDFHEEYKFCPNCGAKMEGGAAEDRHERAEQDIGGHCFNNKENKE